MKTIAKIEQISVDKPILPAIPFGSISFGRCLIRSWLRYLFLAFLLAVGVILVVAQPLPAAAQQRPDLCAPGPEQIQPPPAEECYFSLHPQAPVNPRLIAGGPGLRDYDSVTLTWEPPSSGQWIGFELGCGDFDRGRSNPSVDLTVGATITEASFSGTCNVFRVSYPSILPEDEIWVSLVTIIDERHTTVPHRLKVTTGPRRPYVQLGDPTVLTSEEGSSVAVDVELDFAPTEAVSVDVSLDLESGVSASDISLSTTSLSFAAGETTKTLMLEVADNGQVNVDDREFGISFTNPTPVDQVGVFDTVWTGSIADDEQSVVSATPATNVSEGEPLTFTVELSSPVDKPVTVDWSTMIDTVSEQQSRVQIESADLAVGTPTSGTLSFAAGETSKTISFPTSDDQITEGSEALELTLSNALADGVAHERVSLSPISTYRALLSPSDIPILTTVIAGDGSVPPRDIDRAAKIEWDLSSLDRSTIRAIKVGYVKKPADGSFPPDYQWTTVDITDTAASSLVIPSADRSVETGLRLDAASTYLVRIGVVSIDNNIGTVYSLAQEVETPPEIRINLSGPSRVTEGERLDWVASLNGPLSEEVILNATAYIDPSVTAEQGDFADGTRVITIPAGSTEATLSIDTGVDIDRDHETFLLEFDSPNRIEIWSPSPTVTIEELAPTMGRISAMAGDDQGRDSDRKVTVNWEAPVETGFPDISYYEIGWVQKPTSGSPAADQWQIHQTSDDTSRSLTIPPPSPPATGGQANASPAPTQNTIDPATTYLVRVAAHIPGYVRNWSEPIEVSTVSAITLTISPTSFTVVDGSQLAVTAMLSQPRSEPVEVVFTPNLSAPATAETEDVNASVLTLSIPAGQVRADGVISTFTDLDLDDESFAISVSSTQFATISVDEIPVTLADRDLPQPTNLLLAPGDTQSNDADRALTVSWQYPANIVGLGGFFLRYSQVDSGVWSEPVSVAAELRTHSFSGLSPNTSYQVQIRAFLTTTSPISPVGWVSDLIASTILLTPSGSDRDYSAPSSSALAERAQESPFFGRRTVSERRDLIEPPRSQRLDNNDHSPTTRSSFGDISSSKHSAAIDMLASLGIVRGCNPPDSTRFCPTEFVTRGEMASMLARFVDQTSFSDSDSEIGSRFSVGVEEIVQLTTIGLSDSCATVWTSRWCQDQQITRAQFAAVLANLLGLSESKEQFNDLSDSPHSQDIARLAAEGITHGCNPPNNDRFCPDRPLTRAELATFLTRSQNLST